MSDIDPFAPIKRHVNTPAGVVDVYLCLSRGLTGEQRQNLIEKATRSEIIFLIEEKLRCIGSGHNCCKACLDGDEPLRIRLSEWLSKYKEAEA